MRDRSASLTARLAALTSEQRSQLTKRFNSAKPSSEKPSLAAPVPVAIIGVGCRFPGANSPEQFWRRLCEGYDAVRVLPADRWDAEEFFSSDVGAPGKSNSRWGSFVDHIDRFDREFFGLSPREAAHMDPQQRLLLECAWEALEDSGQMTDKLAGHSAGVFIGAHSQSIDYYLMQTHDRKRLDTYTATGTAHSILANRLSFLFDLRGPSLAVDTACSSSLVAVHLACQSLRTTECDLAIAGGVNLILTPDFQICLGKLEMMAPDGRCKTFDHRANGFVRGEGCGVIVLKRLPDALRDGDPVLAVILGSAVNQDGASNGLTAPNGPAQERVVRRALEVAQVAPGKVSYIETHGTGTALGDPIEVEALAGVLGRGGVCVLGALKTNLGHLEAAAGIAGLIKAVLCLKHGSIPPNLHFERLNPHISLEDTPFVLPDESFPWPRGAQPRIAGVSAFGFGGTNAHIVLSDVPVPDDRAAGQGPVRLLPISARSVPALRELAASYVAFLTTGDGARLPPGDIAYTASMRRRHHQHRLCVAGSSATEWATALSRQLGETNGVSTGSPAIVFTYSGQGSLWPGAGSELIEAEPVFRETLERCDALFRLHAPWSIMAELSAPEGVSRLDQPQIAEAARFALQVALTETWRSWGIHPQAVVGTGLGEAAAAYAAGVLSLPDAVRVVCGSFEGIQTRSPQIRIFSTVSGRLAAPDDFSQEYWARDVPQSELFGKVIPVLLAENHHWFVEIGPDQGLLKAIEEYGGASPRVVASLRRDVDERRWLLDGLASMHAAGCSVNWRHFFPESGRCVDLPRYPWQRQRYWLSAPPEEKPEARSAPPADWFYGIDWQPHSSLRRDVSRTSALAAADLNRAAVSLEGRVPDLARQYGSESSPELRTLLDHLSLEYIQAAFAGLGAPVSTGSHWPKAGFDWRLGILPRYRRLGVRLLHTLAAAGVIRDDGSEWTVLRSLGAPWSRPLIDQFDNAREVLQLHERCGSRLAEVLRGGCDPLSLLLAEQETWSAETIYRDAAPSRLGNRMAAELLRELLERLPAGRTLRILEIGAGTGSTTEALLPLLPADRCEYVFSDLSQAFLNRAARDFARFPFVRFERLDLERPPADQGFADGQFDLVIAANVIHATRDVGASLDHAKRLLTQAGILLLVECTAPRPWMDITFGLTDGWWHFTDRRLREAHPLLDETAWVEVLARRGFGEVTALPLQQPGAALFDQALIFARKIRADEKPSRRMRAPAKYLIFNDEPGLSDELRRQIEARGDFCYLCDSRRPEVLVEAGREWKAAIFIAARDRESGQATDLVDACLRPLRAIQALSAAQVVPRDGLWLVTTGAQPVTPGAAPSLEQSILWGLGRGVALEAPDLCARLVDLDPADSLDASAAALLAEIDDPSHEDQIALRHQQRYVARLTRAAPLAGPGTPPLRVAGTHVVTGGLGGLGSQLALHLAHSGAGHLVLVVQHPLPERRLWDSLPVEHPAFSRVQTVREIEAAGPKVTVAALDLADESSLENLFGSLDFAAMPLRGVWHTAMSLSLAPLGELDPDTVRTMIRVKSAAGLRLHELTRGHRLDHFVLFSSTTGLWGAAGLAHYAAANTFLDALAHFRKADGLPASVVNWGTWEQTRTLPAAERDKAARIGMKPMQARAALRALDLLLATETCQAVVADVDWRIFKPAYESRRPRPFLGRMGVEPLAVSTSVQDDPAYALIDRLESAEEGERRELLAGHLYELLAAVLGTAKEDFIERGTGFFDLGMDSLTSVQLRRRLESDLRRPLPGTLTFNYPTVDLLTDFLMDELFPRPPVVSDAGLEYPPVMPGVSHGFDGTEDELFDQLAEKLLRRPV